MAGPISKLQVQKRFALASATPKPRIMMRIAAEIGGGKTDFALDAPGPIFVQTLDQGLEGVVEPYVDAGKEIRVQSYTLGIQPGEEVTHDMAVEIRAKLVEDFEFAVASGYFRTIVLDRESDFWGLSMFAEFGIAEKTDAFGGADSKDWNKLRGKIKRMYAMVKATPMNMLALKGMRNEWGVSGVNPRTGKKISTPTGNRIPDGMEEVDGEVNIVAGMSRVDRPGLPSQFFLNVEKSRGAGSRLVQGQTFEIVKPGTLDEDGEERMPFGFKEFAQLVFPGTTEEDWR